jgi:hypothetical protein
MMVFLCRRECRCCDSRVFGKGGGMEFLKFSYFSRVI